MKYEIIDNFLDQISFEKIKSSFFPSPSKKIDRQNQFLWNYNKGIVRNPDHGPTGYEKDDWMYTHSFVDQNKKVSDYLFLIKPIFEKIDAHQIIDARANLLTPTEKQIHHEKHIDRNIYHKVALFYVTTSSGYTVLEDIMKVECIENRMLIFDGNIFHHSVSSTGNIRCAININYIPYMKIGNFKFVY
jgi:hypothetical protein